MQRGSRVSVIRCGKTPIRCGADFLQRSVGAAPMHRSYEVTFRRGEKVWQVFQARERGGHTQNGFRFNAS
jgi:hypothetical protein